MPKQQQPEVISLTHEDVELLKKRVSETELSADDQKVLLATLSFNFWLQTELTRAQLTILRLNKIFGLATEKKKSLSNEVPPADNPNLPASDNAPDTTEETPTSPSASNAEAKPKQKPKFNAGANHGRNAANDYSGCPVISIPHAALHAGEFCPSCKEEGMSGKLCREAPQVIVQLTGNPLITGTRYSMERTRCSLCKEYYTAPLPADVAGRGKYDERCSTVIAIGRYYTGYPFYRIERVQALQGVPLADATQWDLMKKLYQIIFPVYGVLKQLAANGTLLSYDDTGNRILEAYVQKKAVHTTAFISQCGEHAVYLFFTSHHHAGINAGSLLDTRTTEAPLITMTDASSQNIPQHMDEDLIARWILCFCLVHGRRKFYELHHLYKTECEFVLNIISEVYRFEAHCKQQKLSPAERLEYHQTHSAPLMQSLRVWLNNQLLHRQVEPNSAMGGAIAYLLRHWEPLTRFLHVIGAPIDNSLCEQAIKVAIRHRRNSLFFRTYNSAQVGDCLMSVIHTAAQNKINMFDYLNTLQVHATEVEAHPEDWLPWNYQGAQTGLNQPATQAA